ncbi:MAG: PspA/IM30 family protein [Pleurocapsa sp. MO_226.B13]|nr:PspA/IM30 family protein [Pleurocapsa sp. MO_226.B13]
MNKKITYWLLGETAGRTSVAAWKWLWGLPVESGGKIAKNVAEESIASMQESIAQLKDAVATIVAAYELAKQEYNLKQDELEEAEKQAKVARDRGNLEAARLAITKAIAIEKILPKLSDRLAQAEAMKHKAQNKLKREIEKLEAYKLEMDNLATLSKINGAMAQLNQISTDFNLDVARSQFTEAKDSIEKKAFLESAKTELEANQPEELSAEIDLLSLEAEIDDRLKNL